MTATSDDAQIRALYDQLMQAWTDGDARAYGECFTPDADYVSYDGTRAAGRDPMVANHDRLFRGVVAGSALVGEVESIRYLRPDVAIVHANGSVLMPWRRKLPRRRFSRQTLVAVRTPDGWRFAALHNTRVRPQALPARTRSPPEPPTRWPASPDWSGSPDGPVRPRLFPTIKGVRLVGREGARQVLEVDHVEGKIINELVVRRPTRSTSGRSSAATTPASPTRSRPCPAAPLRLLAGSPSSRLAGRRP